MSGITADTSGIDKQAARFGAMGDKVQTALTKAMNAAMIDVTAEVKDNKLSGQVLKTRTGRLRRSIHPDVSQDGNQITGTVGTNVVYAAIQEYGGTIHRRTRSQINNRRSFGAYDIVIPEHSYLRSTLAEQVEPVRDRLLAAVHNVVTT